MTEQAIIQSEERGKATGRREAYEELVKIVENIAPQVLEVNGMRFEEFKNPKRGRKPRVIPSLKDEILLAFTSKAREMGIIE